MRILATVLVTVLVLAMGAVAAIHFELVDIRGQNAAVAQQPAPQAAAPQGAPPAAPATPPGQPPSPAQPQITRQQTFQDWIYGCFEAPDGSATRCAISQSLLDADSRALVFLWRIIEDGQGGLMSIWQTPDAVLLQHGIRLDAGTPEPIVVPFVACGGGLCQAGGRLAEEFTRTLATTQRVTATIVARNGQAVTLQISVNGLADGLAALGQPPPTPAEAPAQQ